MSSQRLLAAAPGCLSVIVQRVKSAEGDDAVNNSQRRNTKCGELRKVKTPFRMQLAGNDFFELLFWQCKHLPQDELRAQYERSKARWFIFVRWETICTVVPFFFNGKENNTEMQTFVFVPWTEQVDLAVGLVFSGVKTKRIKGWMRWPMYAADLMVSPIQWPLLMTRFSSIHHVLKRSITRGEKSQINSHCCCILFKRLRNAFHVLYPGPSQMGPIHVIIYLFPGRGESTHADWEIYGNSTVCIPLNLLICDVSITVWIQMILVFVPFSPNAIINPDLLRFPPHFNSFSQILDIIAFCSFGSCDW